MPLTNLLLPGGYVGPGATVYPVQNAPNGAVIYVSSVLGADQGGRVSRMGSPASITSGSNVQGPYGDPAKPLASVWGPNGAWTYCYAGRGDLIIVLPGHAERLSASLGVLPANTTVLGLGVGTGRPTFTWTATPPVITLGNGCQIQNCIFDLTGVVGASAGFNINAQGNQIIGCRIIQALANVATSAIILSSGAADLVIANCDIDASAIPGAARAIFNTATGGVSRVTLFNNWIHGDYSAAPIVSTAAAPFLNFVFEENNIQNQNGTARVVLSGGTADTGIAFGNTFMAGAGLTTANGMISGFSNAGILWAQNFGYFAKAGGPFGAILVPTAGTIP